MSKEKGEKPRLVIRETEYTIKAEDGPKLAEGETLLPQAFVKDGKARFFVLSPQSPDGVRTVEIKLKGKPKTRVVKDIE